MSEKKIITKCCVCGREKTGDGWQYGTERLEAGTMFSHGFCTSCYETELMKVKLRTFARAGALSE